MPPIEKADSDDLESKGSVLPKILDEFVDVAQILAEQTLFLVGCLCKAGILGCVEALGGSLLRTSRGRVCRRCLGHEVEVEEFDNLQLDFSGCAARLEQAGDSKEAVHFLKSAGAFGSSEECGDEDKKGLRLDDGWVGGIEKIEEEVHVAFSAEESA
jgi:hypothetical protein